MAECSVCHLALIVDDSASDAEETEPATDEAEDAAIEARRRANEQSYVVAFATDDPVLLALAKQALDHADIPFLHTVVQPKGTRRGTWQPDGEVPAKLMVNAGDAEEAAAVLADLVPEHETSPQVDALQETQSNTHTMANVQLHNADTNQSLGEITDDELRFLFDRLERESDSDDDFFIDAATIEMLEDAKAPAHLVETLKNAVGSSEGVEVRWTKIQDH